MTVSASLGWNRSPKSRGVGKPACNLQASGRRSVMVTVLGEAAGHRRAGLRAVTEAPGRLCGDPGPRSSPCPSPPPEGPPLPGPPSSGSARNFPVRPTPSDPLPVPAPQPPLTSRPGRPPHLYGPPAAGVASREPLPTAASLPPAQRDSRAPGVRRPLSPPCWRREEFSMVVSMVPLPPSQTAGGPPSRLRSRAAGPSWWAWPEVGGRLGGGAERRCPQPPRGETIEREGQRVMPVRRWGDGLPQASQPEAELGVEGVREPRARAGGLGPWLRAQVFGILGPTRNLRGGHCCQRCAPRAGQRGRGGRDRPEGTIGLPAPRELTV